MSKPHKTLGLRNPKSRTQIFIRGKMTNAMEDAKPYMVKFVETHIKIAVKPSVKIIGSCQTSVWEKNMAEGKSIAVFLTRSRWPKV